jgi:pimeloyl-ACP methyl ester carboxylesterase
MDQYSRAGLHFDVHDVGPQDGEIVVCLHGFPHDGSAFDEVVPLLARGGHRVLVPDQRGYSPGARPPGRRAYVLRELVDDVLALLDAVGAHSAHLVGHDWGGVVAWALAGHHPDQVRSLTVLSAPHPSAVPPAMLRSTQAIRSAHIAVLQVPRAPEAVLLAGRGAVLRSVLVRSGLPERVAGRYVARMRESNALSCALAWYRAVPLWGAYRLKRVSVPTTFVWGNRDPSVTAQASKLTASYVDGPFEVTELTAGHWLPETQPHVVANTVQRAITRTAA